MHTLWHWLLYWLTWASADPALLDDERARGAGAVVVAYAGLLENEQPPPRREVEKAPPPADTPKPERPPPPPRPAPCRKCNDTGRQYRSDGGWVRCDCGACPTGRCPVKK